MCDRLRYTAEQHGEMVASTDPVAPGAWDAVTWNQARERVLHPAAGLLTFGLEPGEARVEALLAAESDPAKYAHVIDALYAS
jgi:long-subunit acyl-CoA synthetase (AMP-forming)